MDNHWLTSIVFHAVAMACIDEQPPWKARPIQAVENPLNAGNIIVGPVVATAQDDVAVEVAPRGDDASQALLGHAEKAVRVRRRPQRVHGNLDVAVGAVFEADRH